MVLAQFASLQDVEALWRPLASDEQVRVATLIGMATAQLRQRRPTVDDRLRLPAGDPLALDPVLVAEVVATAVKDYLINPGGVTSSTQTVGPYSKSDSFALRGDKDPRGVLLIDDVALAKLDPHTATGYGSIRLGTPWSPPSPGSVITPGWYPQFPAGWSGGW